MPCARSGGKRGGVRTRCACSLLVFSRLLTYDFFRSRACCADTRFRSNLRAARRAFRACVSAKLGADSSQPRLPSRETVAALPTARASLSPGAPAGA